MPRLYSPKNPKGRLGWAGYADIIRALIDKPSTVWDLSVRIDMWNGGMRETLRRMRALDLVQIAELVPAAKGPPVAVWAFGWSDLGIDCERYYKPLQPNAELIAFASIIRALRDGCHSAASLADATGINAGRASVFLKYLRSIGLAYIAEWDITARRIPGGKPVGMHRFGVDRASKRRPSAECHRTTNLRHYRKKRDREQQVQLMRALAPANSVFNLARAA